jgi:basic membrane protein A
MIRARYLLVALAALALVAAGCGSDDGETGAASSSVTEEGEDGAGTADTSATTDDTAGTEDATEEPAADTAALDTNGDGEVLFGVATPGPRDDGAYYQALIEGIEEVVAANGFAEPIVVDNIPQADAATELGNLAAQGVDVIVVAASEIADPMPDLAEEHSDIFWYCNCGAGFPESDLYAQSLDDSSEISYTAGYATGLLMTDSGGSKATFIGCCDLAFETEALLAFEAGLQAVDESFTVDYVPAGDFDDVAAATEAFNNALSSGSGAVYPFLGGGHEPVVQLANENDVITMSAGASNACERSDLDYQIAVRFNGGDYIKAQIGAMISGEFGEGDVKTFHVGVDPEPGAVICDASAEQQAAMDDVISSIAAGELTDLFGGIKAEAYGG